jgi:formate-dependent nitrite reductase cytochrome c552 subunit
MTCHRSFDHQRTVFPLTGRHLNTACSRCHNARMPNTRKTRKTVSGLYQCRQCHPSPHPGNKPKCADCHDTQTWRVSPW